MDLHSKLSYIQTKDDLVEFIGALRQDLDKNGEAWENPTLDRFLGAMAGWVADMEGAYKNSGKKIPNIGWQVIGAILMAGAMYE